MTDNQIPTIVIDITGGVVQMCIGNEAASNVRVIVVDRDEDRDPEDAIEVRGEDFRISEEYVEDESAYVADFVKAWEGGA